MDTNILIRTFTVGRGWMQFPVGGGIVADSDPDSEYAETCTRPRGCCGGYEPDCRSRYGYPVSDRSQKRCRAFRRFCEASLTGPFPPDRV